LESLFSESSSEIRHHALIGAAVAIAVIVFDLFERAGVFAENGAFQFILGIITVVVAFALAFVLIFAVDTFVMRHRPLPIQVLGHEVDGYWIYLTRSLDAIHFDRVSVAHMSSSPLGFTLEGNSYSPNGADGYFRGAGTLLEEDGVQFFYRGGEPGARDDYGCGYYRFRRDIDDLCIDGHFTGFRLGPEQLPEVRELGFGTKLDPEGYKKAYSRYARIDDLQKCLDERDPHWLLDYLSRVRQPTSRRGTSHVLGISLARGLMRCLKRRMERQSRRAS
jgi:hypothetical protein